VLPHTAATIALTEGAPLHVVAGRLGDPAETLLATYAHLLPPTDEIAAETVAAVLVDKPLRNPRCDPYFRCLPHYFTESSG
jgi:hypothetical protein